MAQIYCRLLHFSAKRRAEDCSDHPGKREWHGSLSHSISASWHNGASTGCAYFFSDVDTSALENRFKPLPWLKQEETSDLGTLVSTHWRSAQIFIGNRKNRSGPVWQGNVTVVDMMLSVARKVCCSAFYLMSSRDSWQPITCAFFHLIEIKNRSGFWKTSAL